MSQRVGRWPLVVGWAWWCAVATGCPHRRPPILFGNDGGEPSAAFDASVGPMGTDAGNAPDAQRAHPALLSSLVPGDGTSLTVDGVTLRGQPGERFLRYVAVDPDGDGDRDVVLLGVRANETQPRVEFFRRSPAQFDAVPLGASDPPAEPRCTDAVLRSTSSHSAVVTYTCMTPGTPITPLSGISAQHLVVELAPSNAVRLRIDELFPVPSGTVLRTEVTTTDRDGDGVDDVVLTVSARGATERADAAATAQIVLLQRAGVYARDTSEPEASFARIANAARALLTRRRANEAIAAVERAVRLRRAICSDAGAPRVRFGSFTGIACASSEALRSLPEILARAYILLGEYPAAAALMVPDTASEFGILQSPRILADIRRGMPMERGLLVRPGPSVGTALQASSVPRATALSFDPPRSPLAIIVHGEVPQRVELSTLAASRTDTQSDDVRPRALDGSRVLLGVFETCDGVFVALCPLSVDECVNSVPRADRLPAQAVMIRISDFQAPDRSSQCVRDGLSGTASVSRALQVRPVGFGREGLVLSSRGLLYRAAPGDTVATHLGPGVPLGGPFGVNSTASPSGEFAAIAGADGIYVRDSAGHYRVWADPQLAGRYRMLTDLVVSDDGRTVAAMLGAQLWVFAHDIPAPSPPAQPPTLPLALQPGFGVAPTPPPPATDTQQP